MVMDKAAVNICMSVACCVFIIHLSGCLFFYMAFIDGMQVGSSTA
jgi:hypothetical protein